MKPTRADFEPNLGRKSSIGLDIKTITIKQNDIVNVTVRTDMIAQLLFAAADTMETVKDKAALESLAKQSLGWQ